MARIYATERVKLPTKRYVIPGESIGDKIFSVYDKVGRIIYWIKADSKKEKADMMLFSDAEWKAWLAGETLCYHIHEATKAAEW